MICVVAELISVIVFMYVTRCIDGQCQNLSTVQSQGGSAFYIFGFFPVTNEFPVNISTNGILKSEVMRFEISKFNEQHDRINDSDLMGYKMFDTCGPNEVDITSEAILSIALSDHPFEEYHVNNQPICPCENQSDEGMKRTLGVVGPSISSKCAHVNKLLAYNRLPMVSYGSTSSELSNTENYPQLYRTILSDIHQARFLTNFLVAANWTYISILNSDDPYGRAGAHELNVHMSLCIYLQQNLVFPLDEGEVMDAMKRFNGTPDSNVIVLWGHFNLVQAVLIKAYEMGVDNKIWVISEVSAKHPWFHSDSNKLRGTIFVVVANGGNYTEFEEYFFGKTYDTSVDNPWLQTFFRSKGVNSTNGRNISMRSFQNLFQVEEIGFTRNAVATYLNAFTTFVKSEKDCDISKQSCNIPLITDHNHFGKKYLQKVNFKGLNGEYVNFDENGDLQSGSFELYEVVKTEQTFSFVTRWDSNTPWVLDGHAFDIIRMKGSSSCSEKCPPGTHPLYNNLKGCCWKCVKCKPNYITTSYGSQKCRKCNSSSVSNHGNTECIPLAEDYVNLSEGGSYIILLLSITGIIITLFVIITFIRARNSRVILSTNVVPSTIQLFVHLLLFISPCLLIGEDTRLKCALRTFGVGSLFVMVVSIRLVKVSE